MPSATAEGGHERLRGAAGTEGFIEAVGLTRRERKPGRKGRPTCADCFFHCRLLCALDLDAPCSTFRPETPEGLAPPRQPALLLRQGD